MKTLIFISAFFCIFSCLSFTASAQKTKKAGNHTSKRSGPKFIDAIEINPGEGSTALNTGEGVAIIKSQPVTSTGSPEFQPGNIERSTSLQFKYAQLLNCNVELIKNLSLYNFIDEWWQTRYRYGGTTKSGIDCSAFTALLMSTVFGSKLPRTARDQYDECDKLENDKIAEGDLLFFNTRRGVSHVGVYLGEHYFVHASTNSGVTISSLDDPYYNSRFIGGGRVISANNDLAKKTVVQ